MEQHDEQVSSFFCVPDITGFTKLVATADPAFASELIPALLRKMINVNVLKMSVAEIEGDAIFFYRAGRLPSINQVLKQCELLYEAFINHLWHIEKTDKENYDKHLSNGQLGLKIVVHCGMVNVSNIKGRTKFIGQDVIIVHKLLKNSIPENEYILFTQDYLRRISLKKVNTTYLKNIRDGKEHYDYIGEIPYRYILIKDFTDKKLSLLR